MKRFFCLATSFFALVMMLGSLPTVAGASDGPNMVTLCMMSPNGYFPGQLIERDLAKAHDLANYLNGISNEETSWLMNLFASLFGVDPPAINPQFEICMQYDFLAPNGCECTESLPDRSSEEQGDLQYCFVRQGAEDLGTVVTQSAGRAQDAMDLFNSMSSEDTSAFTDFFAWLMGAEPAQDLEFVPRACEDFSDAGGGKCRCDGHNVSGPFEPSEVPPTIDDGGGSTTVIDSNPGREEDPEKEHKVTRRRR